MEDQVLSSMCTDPVSYFTFNEQREALEQCNAPQRKVSRDGNTYIHMVVPILGHWVAVQVTISPFTLERFPGQTFFSSQLRYGPCCHQVNHGDTWDIVRDTVQKVVDSCYRPVCWDYSLDQYCTLDHPSNIDIEQCVPVVKSRIQVYARSTQTGSTSLAQGHKSTTDGLAPDRSIIAVSLANESSTLSRQLSTNCLLAPAQFSNTDTRSSQGHATRIETFDSPYGTNSLACRTLQSPGASLKRKVGSTGSTAELNKRHKRISKESKDAQLVENTMAWLKEGLAKLSDVQSFPSLVTLSDVVPTQRQADANTCADYLWRYADKAETTSAAVIWSLRYVAACSSLVGATFASSPSTVVMGSESIKACRHSIHNWRCSAEIINSIINGMLPSWNNEAYLIYHVFAAKGKSLSSVARLSEARRKTFVLGVVDALKLLSAPSRIAGLPLFNPTIILGGILCRSHKDICQAIGLPLAINIKTIESEGPSVLIPDMANLCYRINELHVALLTPGVVSTPNAVIPMTNQAPHQQYSGNHDGGLVESPQHGLDKPASPGLDLEVTNLPSGSEANMAYDWQSENSGINTVDPMLSPALFVSPQPIQLNLNRTSNQQEAPYWNDMDNPYWHDMDNPYWHEMGTVGQIPALGELPLEPATLTC